MARSIWSLCVALVLTASGLVTAPVAAVEEATASSENFTITYSTEPGDRDAPNLADADANGIPDSIERALREFEDARRFEIEVLGYRPPPNDGDYPLYVAAAEGRGYTRSLPGGSGESKPSYTVVPPDILDPDLSDVGLGSFAAHEYMHAIQNGYDAGEDHWIKEASAAWMEDVYLDEANPNHFMVGAFIRNPRESLTSTVGIHEYGAFLFLQFLAERYAGGSVEGIPLVRELWEAMAVLEAGGRGLSSVEAIGAWLAERDVTWVDAWGEFVLWNRRLVHYEEGAGYRAAMKAEGPPRRPLRVTGVATESCRLTTDEGSSRLPPLSADYVKVKPDAAVAAGTVAKVAATGPIGSTGLFVIRRRDGDVIEGLLAFDDSGFASSTVPFDPTTIKNVVLGLGSGAPLSPPATIAYSLRVPGRSETAVTIDTPSFTTFGESVRISGSTTCVGEPAPFARVEIAATDATGVTTIWPVTTDASGSFSLLATPETHTTYSPNLVDPLLSGAAADSRRVLVRVRVTMAIEPQTVEGSRPVQVGGDIYPPHPGAPVAVEYRRPERRWRLGAEAVGAPDGSYEASMSFPGTGVWEVRARVTATGDSDHSPNDSVSKLVYVRSRR